MHILLLITAINPHDLGITEDLLNKNPLCWLLETFHVTTAGHCMKPRICFHLTLIQREVFIFHIAMRFLSEHCCSVVCQDTSLPYFTHETEAQR